MGPSEEGVLFVPCLGRWDATQGPQAEISRHPPGWVRPVPWGGARALRERCWGGGGAGPEARGGGAAAGLLWRPTLGRGGDPPPSTWTVAEAWADALTPGRGGRAGGGGGGHCGSSEGSRAPDGRGALARRAAAAILRPGTQAACARSPRSPSPAPAAESSFTEIGAAGGWGVVCRGKPDPGSAAAVVAAAHGPR